jgi:hypothetical protein
VDPPEGSAGFTLTVTKATFLGLLSGAKLDIVTP